jgi:hypothetical protein
MLYIRRRPNVWEVRLNGGGERPVTDLTGKHGELGTEALTTDGQFIYFTWEENFGDIWVMDVAYE